MIITPRTIALFVMNLEGGGAERVAVWLAQGLAIKGHTVKMMLLQAKGTYLEQGLLPTEVEIIDLHSSRVRYGLWSLIKALRRHKPDAIVSFGFDTNILSTLARFFVKIPKLILSEHNHASLALKNYTIIQRSVFSLLMRCLYRFSDNIVAVSKGVGENLKYFNIPTQKINVIYNPIDIASIKIKSKETLHQPWFESKEIPVILAVGRLEPQKNFPLLLDAFALVQQKTPCRLMILGEGKLRPELEQKITALGLQNHVNLHGFAANPFAYMARSDLFVMSSDYEGLPTVMIEAMACGCPIVSTDCPSGPAEILENGKNGTLVPVGDAKALAEAILTNLTSPNKNVVERAEFFSVERAVNQYLDLINA